MREEGRDTKETENTKLWGPLKGPVQVKIADLGNACWVVSGHINERVPPVITNYHGDAFDYLTKLKNDPRGIVIGRAPLFSLSLLAEITGSQGNSTQHFLLCDTV